MRFGAWSRFSRLPRAASSWISGGEPGLDLQREVVEGVFIHDQSLIQKVLGHLARVKKKEKKEKVNLIMC